MSMHIRNIALSLAESLVALALVAAPVAAYVLAGRNAGLGLTYHQAGCIAVVALAFLWLIVTIFFSKPRGREWRAEGTGLALYVSLDREIVVSVSLLVVHLRVRYQKP